MKRTESDLAGEPRHPYAVLEALDRAGGRASFIALTRRTKLSPVKLTAALERANARGWVAARPQADNSMQYSLTKLGFEFLQAFRTGQIAMLRRMAAIIGLDRVKAYTEASPDLFLHDGT